MDLPNCPACGEEMRLETPRGPARCRSCGFSTPVELDAAALGHLLQEASDRALGPRHQLTHGRQVEGPRLGAGETPSLLDTHHAPDLPGLRPPTPPPELRERAPPELGDPRATLRPPTEGEAPSAAGRDLERARKGKRSEMDTKGELLR